MEKNYYIENERFIEAYNLLINDNKINSKSDLAQKIGNIPQNIYDIFSNRAKISSKILGKQVENLDFVVFGKNYILETSEYRVTKIITIFL